MAQRRLTNTLRQQILGKILDHAFAKREEILMARELRLAIKVRDRKLGSFLHSWKAMPDFLRDVRRDSARVRVGGQIFLLKLPKDVETVHQELSLAADDPLGEHITRWADDRRTLLKQREELRAQAWAILCSVTTVKRLLEVWPETREFIPAEEASKELVSVTRVNQMIQELKTSE